jgi:spore coat polysaccharide biosynthesis protein SpsF
VHVVAVIQARMSSTRLPGKILASLGNGTVLSSVVGAARSATLVDEVIVATSTDATDDDTQEACRSLDLECVRGSLEDVVSRYKLAIRDRGADAVVRLTADCPLLDPRLIDQCVAVWCADPKIFMATNALVRTYPRGFDVEVLSVSALDWIDEHSRGHDRTHVTSLLLEQAIEHPIVNLSAAVDNSDLRVTVDTPEDLSLVRCVVDELADAANDHDQVTALLRKRADIRGINAHVLQKEVRDW